MPLTIESRSIGQRRPLFDGFMLPPPEGLRDDGSLLLRDLIEYVVCQQVEMFNRRQSAFRLDRVLTIADIERGAAVGKIDPAGKPSRVHADVEEAVANALQSFEDGLYIVILDEVERRTLDEHVYLSPSSRMVFIRLTFLAGA